MEPDVERWGEKHGLAVQTICQHNTVVSHVLLPKASAKTALSRYSRRPV